MNEDKLLIPDAPGKSCTRGPFLQNITANVRAMVTVESVIAVVVAVAAIVAAIVWLDVPIYHAISVPAKDMPIAVILSDIARLLGDWVGLIFGPILLLLAARKRFRYAGRTYFSAFLTQTILTDALKGFTGRLRPNEGLGDPHFYGMAATGSCGFPSGHASFTFMIATLAAAYFPRWRWLFYSLSTFVALGRVIGNRHFFGDVLAGALLGYLVSKLFLAFWPARPVEDKSATEGGTDDAMPTNGETLSVEDDESQPA